MQNNVIKFIKGIIVTSLTIPITFKPKIKNLKKEKQPITFTYTSKNRFNTYPKELISTKSRLFLYI